MSAQVNDNWLKLTSNFFFLTMLVVLQWHQHCGLLVAPSSSYPSILPTSWHIRTSKMILSTCLSPSKKINFKGSLSVLFHNMSLLPCIVEWIKDMLRLVFMPKAGHISPLTRHFPVSDNLGYSWECDLI